MKMKRLIIEIISGLVMLVLLMNVIPPSVVAIPPSPSLGANVHSSTDQGLKKINSLFLREKALSGGDEDNLVIVFMKVGTDLHGLVQYALVRKPMKGITYATGWTKSSDLTKLASIAGVFAVMSPEDFHPLDPKYPDLEPSRSDRLSGIYSKKVSLDALRQTKPQSGAKAQAMAASDPPDWYGVSRMGATAAWAQGFKGQGVIISDVDTGVDFGHPDLDELWQNNTWIRDGAWARVMNPSSPYFGWPMAYDPVGAYTYLGTGKAFSPDTVCPRGQGADSSYSDTSTVVNRSAAGTAVLKQVTYDNSGNCSLVSKTYTLPNTSKSGNYHVSIHPDSLLSQYQNDDLRYAGVLVVDENTAGVYDTVYVDWDGNLTFDTWERFTKDHPTGWYYDPVINSMSRDVSGDGIADISAGLMNWIADGSNYIPGTDVVYNLPIAKPGNGNLVLWFGDFNGNSHGTATTSSAVGRGVITGKLGSKTSTSSTYGPWMLPDWDAVNHGVVWGTAPEAKVFAGYSTIPADVWRLTAVGYDGVGESGDEAQISSNSFGYYDLNDGWDPTAHLVTYLNTVMGFNKTTFISGSANGGFGYGTAASPGSAATGMAIGAINHIGVVKNETSRFTDSQEWIAGSSQILYGDMTPFSSRGPTTMAQTKPNVLAIGAGAPGDVPLNLSVSALLQYSELDINPIDGNRAWELFGGTSQATPFAAGVMALIYQAYKSNPASGGQWPTYEQAKAILMASAKDAGNDGFVQGAGVLDAEWAVSIASGDLGVYVDPPQWVPGNYRGENYISFANIVNPGQSYSREFQVHNPTPTTASVQLEAITLKEIGYLEYTVNTTLSMESESRTLRPDYLITLYNKAKGINDLAKIAGYQSADMIKVTISNPYSQSSLSDPSIVPQSLDSSWNLKLYEWQDLNKNGVLWNDANHNGVVNDGELDNSPGTTNPFVSNSSQEMNSYGLSYQVAPTAHEVRIATVDEQKPWARLQGRNADGFFIGLMHKFRNTNIPTTTIKVRVTLYQEKRWPNVSFNTKSLSIPSNTSQSFSATFKASRSWGPGFYEGAIRVKFTLGKKQYRSLLIPILFNVAMQPVRNAFRYEFGNVWKNWPTADPPADAPYDNKRIFGGQDWIGNGWYDQGDWRLFYADVTDAAFEALPPNAKWIVDTKWVAKPTDIDTLIYGPTDDSYSAESPEVYGPYSLALIGGSDSTVYKHPDKGGYAYTFRTNTGEPREIICSDLKPGLNGIFLHNVLYGGSDTSEPFAGRAGYVAVNPSPASITANQSGGSLNLTFQSSLDWSNGLGATAYGLTRPTEIKGISITQGGYWDMEFDVTKAASVEMSTSTTDPATTDIDLYLYKQTGSTWQFISSSVGTTAAEQIKVRLPADGHYLAEVYGYRVTGNGKFDFSMNVIKGDDLTVTNLPTGNVAAEQKVTFTLNVKPNLTEGSWYGVLMLGPAEAPNSIEVPVSVLVGPSP